MTTLADYKAKQEYWQERQKSLRAHIMAGVVDFDLLAELGQATFNSTLSDDPARFIAMVA